MPCAIAAFDDKRAGVSAGRAIQRAFRANTSLYRCGECDHFHVVVDATRYPVSGSWQDILTLLAQGMTRHEIAKNLEIPVRTVDDAIYEMRKRFYALNRPHLVAIAIALGIVNPNTFVPTVSFARTEEKAHEGS